MCAIFIRMVLMDDRVLSYFDINERAGLSGILEDGYRLSRCDGDE